MEVFIVASLYEVATVDVLAGNNNDVNLVETHNLVLTNIKNIYFLIFFF